MSTDDQDMAFARHLRQIGVAKPEQIAQGLALQGRALDKGETIPLAEALVRAGVITASQRETFEKQVRGQQGIQQLLHYRLVRKIGEGSVGVVYLAEDVDVVGRVVALKVLGQRLARDEKFIRRLRREADAAARLKHENIVGAFAYGEDQGRQFYVMEYCDGDTLDRRLKRVGHLTPREATGLVIQVARGLKFAHEKGFIHRDIKPANIIMSGDTAKILDLGLSKNIESEAASVLSMAGAAMGTPNYISPEQALGEKDVDGRTDIYSLGATYYHFVTGVPPFHGSSGVEVLFKHIRERLPDPRDVRADVPEGVAHVIRRMMAKSRGDRYRDCGELLEDLQRLVDGRVPLSQAIGEDRSSVALPRVARAPSARPSTTRRVPLAEAPARRRALTPWGWIGLGVGIMVVLGLVFLSCGVRKPRPPKSSSAPPADPAVVSGPEAVGPLDRFLEDIRAAGNQGSPRGR